MTSAVLAGSLTILSVSTVYAQPALIAHDTLTSSRAGSYADLSGLKGTLENGAAANLLGGIRFRHRPHQRRSICRRPRPRPQRRPLRLRHRRHRQLHQSLPHHQDEPQAQLRVPVCPTPSIQNSRQPRCSSTSPRSPTAPVLVSASAPASPNRTTSSSTTSPAVPTTSTPTATPAMPTTPVSTLKASASPTTASASSSPTSTVPTSISSSASAASGFAPSNSPKILR